MWIALNSTDEAGGDEGSEEEEEKTKALEVLEGSVQNNTLT